MGQIRRSAVTHRAAVLQDAVPEPGVALRPQLLAVGPSEDQGLHEAAALPILVSHAVPAVERDGLVRLLGEDLQKLQLDRCGVRLLLLPSVLELKRDQDVTPLLPDPGLFTKHSRFSSGLTLDPPFMSAPNQTGLPALGLDFVHQVFLGTLAGLAEMQVSPVSMSQKTLMASLLLP